MAKGNNKKKNRDFYEEDFNNENYSYSKSQVLKLKPFKPKTESQQLAYDITKENTLTFLGGPAGVGKTICLCYVALDYLAKGKVKKITLIRPALEAKGENLGFLPGGADEKVAPYLMPLFDNFEIFLGSDQLQKLLDEGIIECLPVAHARGRTINDSFIIIDEGQNLTKELFHLILTRIGFGSYAGFTYDENQVDLKKLEQSCVFDIEHFRNYDTIGHFEFSESDVVRSPIAKLVVQILSKIREEQSGGII